MTGPDPRVTAAAQSSERALALHPFYRGKIQTAPKVPIRGLSDFSLWYTPGVAASCRAIHAAPEEVWRHTNRANTIAIISDGTRVLGLGDIGPEAGLPVMEGKALLFKYLGGVDAFPLCLGTRDPDELVRAVTWLQPSIGGVNLEDIAQPKCFRVLAKLRETLQIPVWHDDQQGTATVVLAGLLNALAVVGKTLPQVRIALIGCGAANVATYRLLVASGADPRAMMVCDRGGVLHRGRSDVEQRQDEFREKWELCQQTNAGQVTGDIAAALRGSDVCISFAASGPGVIRPEWIRGMASEAIVFACANPVPEIWPWEAQEAGARIVATGRGDFPNQVNNSLGFPAIFRGTLDVRARGITDGMALAAARELAAAAGTRLGPERIVPRMDEWEIYPRIAAAVGLAAQHEGIAGRVVDAEQLRQEAADQIRSARELTRTLQDTGLIPAPPAGG
ncbi:MAG: NADP-dependent malic enzyme [Pirellulales bacterium]